MLCSIILSWSFMHDRASAATYKDVSYQYWAYEDIKFVSAHGIINGYADKTFRPGVEITRKDAVVMMVRTLELQDAYEEEHKIEVSDVVEGSAHYKNIMIALQQGWLTLEEEEFRMNAPLTRDEMSKMLAIAYEYEGKGNSKFEDVERDDPYYPFIDAIAHYKVTTGYNDNTFRPEETVTRAQFSAFIARIYQQPIAYEVKSDGEVVATVPSVEQALETVQDYKKGTIHPKSNKLVEYSQEIGMKDRTGINNSVLIYNGMPPEQNNFSIEYFNHYLKRMQDGQAVDLFDTFVILGLRYNEEGNMFTDSTSNEANYSDWQNYMNRTFSEEGALYNLNASAIENNRVVDVYLSIPYPKRFGDIEMLNGDFKPNNQYTRYDLAKWYLENVTNKFKREQYSNLNLKGFYWLSETVRTNDDGVVISSISSWLKRNNYQFIYSPHASSTNFYKWVDYGFDGAFLQPNAFRTAIANKEERLHKAFINAQIYGTGITMEVDSHGLPTVEQGDEAFELYMDFAERYGLKEKPMMFYQANNMVERMATWSHPVYGKWYDLLTDTFFK